MERLKGKKSYQTPGKSEYGGKSPDYEGALG